jgi:hypothetical protein
MTISSKASHLESLALRKKTYAPSADAKLSLNAPRLVNLRYPNPFTFPTPEERKDALKLHPTRGAASNKSFGTAKKKNLVISGQITWLAKTVGSFQSRFKKMKAI